MTAVLRDEVIALRRRAHGLDGAHGRDPVHAAQRMLAVQAQDLAAGAWALGVRAPGATMAGLAADLAAGRIVRSWPIRGTLHFVAAPDLRWMLAVTAPRMIAAARRPLERMGLDARALGRAHDIAAEVLAGGASLGRRDFIDAIARGGVRTEGGLGYQVICFLAQTGLICWGPPHGTQQALVLADEWIPATEDADGDPRDLLRRLAVRYLEGHGPASAADLQSWAKLTTTDARAAIAAARTELVELELDGRTLWATQRLMDSSPDPGDTVPVVALPGFDEMIIVPGYRRLVVDAAHENALSPNRNGTFLPSVLTREGVAATWRRVGRAPAIHGSPEPWTAEVSLLPVDAGFDPDGTAAAVERYARFFGLPTPRILVTGPGTQRAQ